MNYDAFTSILKEYNIRQSYSHGTLTSEYKFFTMNDKILKHGPYWNCIKYNKEIFNNVCTEKVSFSKKIKIIDGRIAFEQLVDEEYDLAETDEDAIRELVDEMIKKYKNAIKQLRKQKIEEL